MTKVIFSRRDRLLALGIYILIASILVVLCVTIKDINRLTDALSVTPIP
jgi:hypothetical protein